MTDPTTWRSYARKVIGEVLDANPGLTGPDLRRKLSEAYPFGQRKYFPYKVWLDEVRRTLRGDRDRPTPFPKREVPEIQGQIGLFE